MVRSKVMHLVQIYEYKFLTLSKYILDLMDISVLIHILFYFLLQ